MSDTTGKTVTFHGERFNCGVGIDLGKLCGIRARTNGSTIYESNGQESYVRENLSEVIAKLSAALNPPGPGDVTLRQMQEAIDLVYDDCRCHVRVFRKCDGADVFYGDDNDYKGEPYVQGGTFGNILADIASLKPAPAPRDELQKNHDAAIALLRHIEPQVEVSFEKWDGITAVLKRAENLKGKP